MRRLFPSVAARTALAPPPSGARPKLAFGLATLTRQEGGDQPQHKISAVNVPPLFWKAYAVALKSYLIHDSDLGDSGYALFISDPRQSGVPAGNTVPDTITNFQVFTKADCAQVRNKPFYNLDGYSYFDFVDSYLLYALYTKGQQNADDPGSLPPTPDVAKQVKEEAWRADVARWSKSVDGAISKPFVDWMKAHATNYKTAFDKQDHEVNQVTSVVDPSYRQLKDALADARKATNRLEFVKGYNMKSVSTDDDWLRNKHPTPPSETDAFYQPQYALSNYDSTATVWINSYEKGKFQSIMLDFEYAKTVSWASLGHPDLDAASPQQVGTAPSNDSHLYKVIKAQINFSGLDAFPVTRGEWQPTSPLRELGKVSATAPDWLKGPILKTTKLLLGYAVDLVVTLPDDLPPHDPASEDLLRLSFPSSSRGPRANEFHMSVGDNAYPCLLGVLSQVI